MLPQTPFGPSSNQPDTDPGPARYPDVELGRREGLPDPRDWVLEDPPAVVEARETLERMTPEERLQSYCAGEMTPAGEQVWMRRWTHEVPRINGELQPIWVRAAEFLDTPEGEAYIADQKRRHAQRQEHERADWMPRRKSAPQLRMEL